MTDPTLEALQWLALLCLWLSLLLLGGVCIEIWINRPRWLRRLHSQERARVAWQAKVIADQAFFKREGGLSDEQHLQSLRRRAS